MQNQPMMCMMAVGPDGQQMLVPTGGPAMMQPQCVPMSQLSGVPAPGREAVDLSASAAQLEAYAKDLKAAARRAKAAAYTAARRTEGKRGHSGATSQCRSIESQQQHSVADRSSPSSGRSSLSWADEACEEMQPNDERTTLMFRNLPNDYTRAALLELLDLQGFQTNYSFVYLPTDFKSFAGFGYAFVSFVNHAAAVQAKRHFQGFRDWRVRSQKVCDVDWSGAVQGLAAHTERYRNSPVMHKSVPDEYKPALFVDGVRTPFPPPTRPLRPPQVRHNIPIETSKNPHNGSR